MQLAFSLLAGIIFGAGLTISDMVNPARVLNFLDITGTWDPTLILVMAGALAITAIGYRLVFRHGTPIYADQFHLPTKHQIDLSLVGGSALFGVGWGLAGSCPGPAFTALVALNSMIWLFVSSMLVGMLVMNTIRNQPSVTPHRYRPF